MAPARALEASPATESTWADVSAAGCLAFLWPSLAAFAITSEMQERLTAAAKRLAPIARIALELRLNGSTVPPDLHQMVLREGTDLATLQQALDQRQASSPYPPRLPEFLQAWQKHTSAASDASSLFFEWDFAALDQPPAVFVPVDAAHPETSAHASREQVVQLLYALGNPSSATEVPAALWAAAAGGISVSHIGLMSTRGGVLRVNYRGIRKGELGAVLKTLGWPGNTSLATRLFDELVEHSDKVTVGFNFVQGRVAASFGLEVFFEEQPGWEPRWKTVFAYLQAEGVCRADEVNCLLKLPADLDPFATEQPWPAAWILAAELGRTDAVPRARRTLSHLKLSLDEHGISTAKAYVGVQHQWMSAAANPVKPGFTSSRPVRGLAAAQDAGIRFLLSRRSQSGWWTEFRTRLGPSDEWATAFVGCALAEADGVTASVAAAGAVNKLLERERPGGGWGYNAGSPPDADSTAWALRLLQTMGYNGPASRRGIAFLEQHCLPGGGVTTYRQGAPIRFNGGTPLEDGRGWQDDHLCVAANAAKLLGEPWCEALAQRQAADGSWTPYWWHTPALATALAVRALSPSPPYAERVRHAVGWARTYSPPQRSHFVEAWLISILAAGQEDDRYQALQRGFALLHAQRADGSWDGGADLKIPEAFDRVGGSAPNLQYETRRVFTTAAVLMALRSIVSFTPAFAGSTP